MKKIQRNNAIMTSPGINKQNEAKHDGIIKM